MRHLKYKCKVNFVKLPLIWIYRCLKLVFKNAPAGATQAAAWSWTARVAREQFQLTVSYDVSGIHSEYMTHQLLYAVHTRACTGIKKTPITSVTVQNRTRVYMNFFDQKNLGNHLLQLCPKVVKHPVLSEIMIKQKFSGKYCGTFHEVRDVRKRGLAFQGQIFV